MIRENPELLPDVKFYYKNNPADFINDWGVTYEPRNVERGLPATIPFLLFPKQREWIDWVMERWRKQESGATEKSRDCGVTWLAISLSCTLCIHYDGMAIGFGSRKEIYVDKVGGDMKPIIPKGRKFMENLPEEFRAGWVSWRDSPFMRIAFPHTGSLISGEGGDEIGRGDRTGIYFVDEAEHLERPMLVEASLADTTNCRIDVSSVKGTANPIAQKILQKRVKVFVFDWHDDPRKDDAWYAKKCGELDPVVVAQEIDRDRSASVHGIVIPGAWVRACIGACKALGIEPTGLELGALDVADEGIDKNAFVGAKGVEVQFLRQWSGKGSDLYETAQETVNICDERGIHGFRYDADGIGASLRGDMRVINEKRVSLGARAHHADGWRGSEGVFDPDGIVEGTMGIDGVDKGRTNKDYFMNAKAQAWWALRRRAQKTYRWVVQGVACHPDEILSLSPAMPLLHELVSELSQPTYRQNELGKMVINKKPDGLPSPNLADCVMIRYAPGGAPVVHVDSDLMARVRAQLPPRRRYR